MSKLPDFAVRHKTIVITIVTMLVIWGAISFCTMLRRNPAPIFDHWKANQVIGCRLHIPPFAASVAHHFRATNDLFLVLISV